MNNTGTDRLCMSLSVSLFETLNDQTKQRKLKVVQSFKKKVWRGPAFLERT